MADAYDAAAPVEATDLIRLSASELRAIKARLNTFQLASGRLISTNSEFYSGANKVVGARDTGWGAATGTASKAAFVAAAAVAPSAGYVQAEAVAVANRQATMEARVAAIMQALAAHGLTGA